MRPVILIFVRYYLPGFQSGGPVRSIANMIEALGDEFEFRVVTSDHDVMDTQPYPGVEIGTWVRVGKAWVYYASEEQRGWRGWRALLANTPHDALYLNSLFDPVFSILPIAAKMLGRNSRSQPVVIATRGELSHGAIAFKRTKKKLFLAMARVIGLYKDVLWHASTQHEADLIQRTIGDRSRVAIACNLPTLPPDTSDFAPQGYDDLPLRLVFLSRIARKKNLDYALEVLARCEVDIEFDIWGTHEDNEFWALCQKLISALPPNVRIQQRGSVAHAQVHKTLARYDLLFFPTRGENYGHVIAEALAVGTPVLISDQTPWRNLADLGIGWDLPLADQGQFVRALETTGRKSRAERMQWRRHVAKYAHARLRDPAARADTRSLFLQAIHGAPGNA